MMLLVVVSLFFCQVLGKPVVGGMSSQIHTYPWMASIQRDGYHRCGGSIVSSTIILTAAHCAKHPRESYIVRVGSTRTDSGGTWHNVVAMKQHEDFNLTDRTVRGIANDVALIKVSPPIELGRYGAPIQLANKEYDVPTGTDVRVIGWGFTSEKGTKTYELKSAKLYIADSGECSRAYGDRTGKGITLRHQICAYGSHSGTCRADSGNPLVTLHNIQVGIVFGGHGCADYRYPGIYESVAYYRDWIDENLKSL